MKHVTFGWQTADNLQIFAQSWQPAMGTPQGVVCLVHGLGEHSSRYVYVADALCNAGFTVITFDLQGHGQSTGKRGHIPTYNSFLDDIDRLLAEAQHRFPGVPNILYGHSLGGNLVLNYVLRRKTSLTGVVASSPWLKLSQPPPSIQLKLGQAASQIWPAFTMNTGLDVTAVSRDPNSVTAYATDRLIHSRVSLRLFTECHRAGLWALDHAARFPLPLLIFHGSADRITCPRASREFATGVPTGCTFKLWDNLYHETHHEPEKQAVLNLIIDWLTTQIS